MSVPALGYVFDDNAKAIRLITGVPGAANLDLPVASATPLESAFIQSHARVAIANAKEGGLVLVQWGDASNVSPLTTALGRATLVAFNSAGDRAAISDGTTVEAWSGLNASPALAASFTPDGGATALAMDPSGDVVAATGSGSVVLLGDEPRVLASGGNWSALAFLPNGTDLLAVDADGSRAAVALENHILIASLTGGDPQSLDCGCHAARLNPLDGNLVFQLADSQDGRLLLFDADSGQPRIASLPELNGGSR
jgi:hypothetical protein